MKVGSCMKENMKKLIGLIEKFQIEELSLEEAIELRRLSAEFTNVCGATVEKKMDQYDKK